MDKIITLEELSEIKNVFGKVQVVFCSSEEDNFEILRREDFVSLGLVKEKLTNRWQYKVFRIDTLDSLMCVYVVLLSTKNNAGDNVNNEVYSTRMVLAKVKKRYMSAIALKEGRLL